LSDHDGTESVITIDRNAHCMLAYYLEWHMRQCLAPMLFDDTDTEEAEALRSSVVAPRSVQRLPARSRPQG
jgi:hypothetical protein